MILLDFLQKRKETLKHFLWRFFQLSARQGILFVALFLSARMLSVYDFGIYSYALTILYLLVLVGDFGISTAASKYVAHYLVTDHEKLRSILFNTSLILVTFIGIFSITFCFFGNLIVGDKYIYILYLLPACFFAPLSALYDGIYRGLKKFKQLSHISFFTGIFGLVSIPPLIELYGLTGALISQDIFYGVLLFFLMIYFRDFHIKFDFSLMKKIGIYAFLVGLINIGYYLYIRTDILIFGHRGLIKEISYYDLAARLFVFLQFPIAILGTVIAPQTSGKFAENKILRIDMSFIKVLFFLFFCGLLLASVVYAGISLFIQIFLPHYDPFFFRTVLSSLLILLPFRYVSVYLESGYMIPGDMAGFLALSTLIGGALNTILVSMFIGQGFLAAIAITALCQVIVSIVNVVFFFYKIKNGSSIVVNKFF